MIFAKKNTFHSTTEMNCTAGHQEDRGSQRDESTYDFGRVRNSAFGGQNSVGDVCTDDEGIAGEVSRGAGSRQYASSGANNVPHNMFGEEDYFKDLGAFFNSADEHVQPTAVQPTSNGTGDVSILPAESGDDPSDNLRPISQDQQEVLQVSQPTEAESVQPKQSSKSESKSKKKPARKSSADIENQDTSPEVLTGVGVEEERVMKNIREKKRRKGVSEKFKELYNLVCANNKKSTDSRVRRSSVKPGRVSKARMLEEAIRLIKNMECECSSLHSRNRFLEYQVRQFQQIPQDNTALAKAASIVAPPIMPFTTHTVNPFLYMNMASLPSNQMPSRRQ